MQPTPRKTAKTKIETKKDEIPSTSKKEEKKPVTSTPKNFVQKSSTADIYGQKKHAISKIQKKAISNIANVSPMKDLLTSSPSTVSHRLKREVKTTKDIQPTNKKVNKNLFANVTINSPVLKKKIQKEGKTNTPIQNNNSQDKLDYKERKIDLKSNEKSVNQTLLERERTKTRTLDESEVKILTTDSIDNNIEMLNLSNKLKAKPKAFFVELEDENAKAITEEYNKPSDEEVSYEDDFESYESDFDSYHSENDGDILQSDEKVHRSDEEIHSSDVEIHKSDDTHRSKDLGHDEMTDSNVKDIKDEEKMLDSGSYDLRDRSAKSKPAVMDFIVEDTEDPCEKKLSLTDEGFQEMSSSSAVSSLKTIQVDVLDRTFFIDFTKSKETKRRRLIIERLKQRAEDLLNMITLHEMSFTLFEMKPVSYDLYMATFGRNNYTQTAVQTFDDGIAVEIQTDLVDYRHIWTQHPVEFSKSDITLCKVNDLRKYSQSTLEFSRHFMFLTENIKNDTVDLEMEKDLDYEMNPLRIYLEQKDGVGTTEVLPYEKYSKKLMNIEHNNGKLRKFLKKVERRISNILNLNTGNIELSGLKDSKLPHCKGYVSLCTKDLEAKKYSELKSSKINRIINSDSKNSLFLTVSDKKDNFDKCVICLWDISVVRNEPIKILIAIDNVIFGVHRGNTDGVFVACLEDGSIHLWDLSEESNWYEDIDCKGKTTELVEINSDKMIVMEMDREWNLKNSNIEDSMVYKSLALQSCGYTNSANNLNNSDKTDSIVGMQWSRDAHTSVSQDGGRKMIGQVATLQRRGILTVWSIIQEKTNHTDIGKAYWSKLRLEKAQCINLTDYTDAILENSIDNTIKFNLYLAKRRISKRKQERSLFSRPKSAVNARFDIDRPASSVSVKNKNVLPAQNSVHIWENIMICNDIRVVNFDNLLVYIIAKNNGDVLCCRRVAGVFKLETFVVSNDTSSVTSLVESPHGLPYFLAATDSGTVNLCSLSEKRVLLTLDCRNISSVEMDRCKADHKGRFISSVANSVPVRGNEHGVASRITIKSIHWSHVNPCYFYALINDGTFIAWDLTVSDIYAKVICEKVDQCVASSNNLAILTTDGEVQLHKLSNEKRSKEYLEIFRKYVALL